MSYLKIYMKSGMFLIRTYLLFVSSNCMSSYRVVLKMNPHHFGFIEQYARALQDLGRHEPTVKAWQAILEEARSAGISEAFSSLEELITTQ